MLVVALVISVAVPLARSVLAVAAATEARVAKHMVQWREVHRMHRVGQCAWHHWYMKPTLLYVHKNHSKSTHQTDTSLLEMLGLDY